MLDVHVNHYAVLLCAVLNLVVGALWYSPLLFEKIWLHEAGVDPDKIHKSGLAKNMLIVFVLSLIITYNLAFFIGGPGVDWKQGALYGFLTGFGWVSMGMAIIATFELKSVTYMFVNGGFITVYFTVIGLILGLWR